jgi:putative membrane protein insertion efficiency factor
VINVSGFIVAALRWARLIKIRNPLLDRLFARMACLAIFLYRALISKFIRNECFFSVTCSAYGLNALREYGWTKGSDLAYKRICDCGGNYSISFDSNGSVVMVVQSGRSYSAAELADHLKQSFSNRSSFFCSAQPQRNEQNQAMAKKI